ncbi:hypothetical protein SprV_0100271800 [Sparganum proliferum]
MTYHIGISNASNAAYFTRRQPVQQRLKEMQKDWPTGLRQEIQEYVDSGAMENSSADLNVVYDHQAKGTAPLLIQDGAILLMQRSQILERWATDFQGSSNHAWTICEKVTK